MRLPIVLVLALSTIAAPAFAAELTVLVRNADGQPVRDAVATLHYAGGASSPGKLGGPYVVSQQNIQFDPFVIVVPLGADVTFPNKDKVRHHVYSFSPAKRFELKLYGREEARAVKFDKVGIVALGCNIHDRMIGFIDVVDTPFAAKSDAAGAAQLTGAPAGPATLTVWHPYLKGPNNQVSRQVVVPRQGDARETVMVDVRLPSAAAGRTR